MARRFSKKGKGKGFGRRDKRDDKDGGHWSDIPRENQKWQDYYKALNLIPEDEWETFKKHCESDLPLTFRITGLKAHAEEVNQKFLNDHVAKLKDVEFEGTALAPKNIAFYPDHLGWQLDVPKSVIRKNDQFAKTQRFLVLESTVGNITRQEAVSMIPPLLMDVQPHHTVLDMCAAPGSKTSQLVEALHAKDSEKPATGIVIANDSNYKRSYMLVHQVKRLNSPNFMVVNHDAQWFPRIVFPDTGLLRFDRILCDVPCSGDGTMRKNINVWKDFTLGDGLGLHPLQVNILTRGLQQLKDGGRLVYSTCSLNPIENEAVVAEALRNFPAVSLVDVSAELPQLKRRSGLLTWRVFDKEMEEKQPGDESVHATAFPPTEQEQKKFNLQRCVRVYPHLQNTGGFFITVFEKTGLANDKPKRTAPPSELNPETKKAKIETFAAPVKREKLPRNATEEPFIFLDPENEQLQKCWNFYQIDENFGRDTFLVRNATGEASRSIYYVSPIVARILKMEPQKLKIVHAGIKMFTAQRKDHELCPWRVQHESLEVIRPHLGPNRQLTTNMNSLKILLTNAYPLIRDLEASGFDSKFCKELSNTTEGCAFLRITREKPLEDLFVALWVGKANVNLMVNKQDTQELLMRLYDIETKSTDEVKEKAHQMRVEALKAARNSESQDSVAYGNMIESEFDTEKAPEPEKETETEKATDAEKEPDAENAPTNEQ